MSKESPSRVQRVWVGVGVTAILGLLLMACVSPSSGGPVGPTTTTSTTLPWSEPTGPQWFGFSLTCNFYVAGQWYNFPEYPTVHIQAPTQVVEGEQFYLTITPGTFDVPTVVEGFALQHLRWMTIRYPMPLNVDFVDSVMSAGIDMGPGYPSLSLEGDYLVYRVPGPFAPGDKVQMPKVRLELRATGVPGSIIETRMQSLTNVAQFALGSVSNTCNHDDPGRVFTTTEIIAGP
jgi:hypothetical protein